MSLPATPGAPSAIAISGGRLLTPLEEFDPGLVIVRGETIEYAGPLRSGLIPAEAFVVEAGRRMIVPGFIDLHVHGAGGRLFSSARSAAELRAAAHSLFASGTTSFLATTGSIGISSKDEYIMALEVIAESAREASLDAPRLLGVHLEGPNLSELAPGVGKAWPKQGFGDPIRDAQDLLLAAEGLVRIAVVSPEAAGAKALARLFRDAGAIVSLGHSAASFEECMEAIGWGMTHATHTFNAMRAFHHRDPGPVAATLLSPEVTNEIIGDGVHIHPAVARLVTEAKPRDRVVLVTDGIGLETAPPGSRTEIEGVTLLVRDDRVTLEDGTLAGGRLPLNLHVRTMVEQAGCELQRAVELVTLNPACELGFGEAGRLAPGKRADIVVLNPDFSVYLTCCGGRVQFTGRGWSERP